MQFFVSGIQGATDGPVEEKKEVDDHQIMEHLSSSTTLEDEDSKSIEKEKNTKEEIEPKKEKPEPLEIEEPLPDRSLRAQIFNTFENPEYSQLAKIISIIVLTAIFVSTINFVLSSLPEFWDKPPLAIEVIEIISISIFTIDYFARLFTAPVFYKWVIQPLNIIDLLSILPFFIELGFGGRAAKSLATLRIIRLIRIFRIFKVGKYSKNIKILVETLKRSFDAFVLLLFCLALILLIFSSLLFYAEQTSQDWNPERKVWVRDDGEDSPFQSIPETFWWCIVTVTTVGYGDTYPISAAGKIVASFTMVFGILVIAFPISVLGSNFGEVWNEKKRSKEEEKDLPLEEKDITQLSSELQSEINKMGEINQDIQDKISEFNQIRDNIKNLFESIQKQHLNK